MQSTIAVDITEEMQQWCICCAHLVLLLQHFSPREILSWSVSCSSFCWRISDLAERGNKALVVVVNPALPLTSALLGWTIQHDLSAEVIPCIPKCHRVPGLGFTSQLLKQLEFELWTMHCTGIKRKMSIYSHWSRYMTLSNNIVTMSESEFKRGMSNLEYHVDSFWRTCPELR